MSESWEKGKKPVELPNPELNPLQNATLGRNLGRWAQVYFTSPPEKREEAVGELLRELQAETDVEPVRATSPSVSQIAVPSLICKFCQQPNELNQSFCGLCGSPLREPNPIPQPTSPAAVSRAEHETQANAKVNILPADDPVDDDESLQWLREKNLGHLSGYDESSGKWKYALAAVVLLAGTFGVLQWLSNRPVGVPNQPSASLPSQAAPAAQAQAPAPQSPAPAETATQSEPAAVHEQQVRPAPPTVPVKMTLPLNAPAAQREGGTEELSLAQGYLEGKHGRRDSAEAAKWLWKAVAKQNSMADVLLADLYVSGDGVAKSCDQARLLLTAATKKGAPGAAEKLRSVESGGCR